MYTLPLFPLQLVVYPGETVNLHIFEPRYRQLLREAEAEGTNFGIPTVIEGALRPLGGEVRLAEVVNRYPDGESDIRVVGSRIFRILDFQREAPGKPFPGGEVEFIEPDLEEDPGVNHQIVELTRAIYRKLNIERLIREADAGFTTYDVAHHVGFTLEQEYMILTLTDAATRQQFLLEHLLQVDPRLGEGRRMLERASLNGHFQHLSPPDF